MSISADRLSVADCVALVASSLLTSDAGAEVEIVGATHVASSAAARAAEVGLAVVSRVETRGGPAAPQLAVGLRRGDGFAAASEELTRRRVEEEEATWGVGEKLNRKQASGTDKHGNVVTNSRGRLLKPAQQPQKMAREIAAYKFLGEHEEFKHFLPKFYGDRLFKGEPHIEMENLLWRTQGPVASVDIKVGRKTWDDDAPEAKRLKESAKIVEGCCSDLGFRLVGLRAGASHALTHVQIRERKDLTREEFKAEGMLPFFRKTEGSDEIDVRTLKRVLKKCADLLAIVEKGYGGTLRAASLFMAREMRPAGRMVFKVNVV